MGMPIGVLKCVMTQREFAEWCWAYHAEPFNDERCYDLPAAMQTATWLNTRLKKGSKPFSATDFMPFQQDAEDDDGPVISFH